MKRTRITQLVMSLLVGAVSAGFAADGTEIKGPKAPVAPEVVSRDDQGGVTLRAIRLAEPFVIDGRLEEPYYSRVPGISEFIQQEPNEGAPASEKTEVWIAYDDTNVYVSARLWHTKPEEIIANELRRDNHNIFNNDNFAVIFDTFYDKRNGFLFHTNPLGALYDAQVTDESNTNSDWNTVWDVRTARFADGWTVEMVFPMKSLRYKSGESQIWGINFRRIARARNEWSYLTPISASFRFSGLNKLSQAATLVGIEAPPSSLNLEVKPYTTAALRTDRDAEVPFENDFDPDIGFDAKYGVTKSLVADFTVNTDFAQVEADDQQVNLTRFNLFFPEKREFFLEGQGIFGFGGSTGRRWGGPQDVPTLFFSRQIGLADGQQVPIRAGGRLTGRAGKYTVGFLNIQTGGVHQTGIDPTNFSVIRVKRDLFGRSNIGALVTHRSESVDYEGSNAVFGLDANFSFFRDLGINAYYAKTSTEGLAGDDESYMARMRYGGDRYGADFSHLAVGDNFNPEVGFVRRRDIRKTSGELRFSPRPSSIPSVRKFSFEAGFDYYETGAGEVETREVELKFETQFQGGDNFNVDFSRSFEFLFNDFEISDGVTIPVGGYDFDRLRMSYRMGPQRAFTGWFNGSTGGFFGGNRTEVGYSGRVELTEKLSLEPDFSFNWVDLPAGSFQTTLLRFRGSYTVSSRSLIGALVQYNTSSGTLSTNIRYRWEYQPGSDLYIVYSDGRDTIGFDRPEQALRNQSLVVKFTRLFRL